MTIKKIVSWVALLTTLIVFYNKKQLINLTFNLNKRVLLFVFSKWFYIFLEVTVRLKIHVRLIEF